MHKQNEAYDDLNNCNRMKSTTLFLRRSLSLSLSVCVCARACVRLCLKSVIRVMEYIYIYENIMHLLDFR